MKRIFHLLLTITLLCITVTANAQVRVGGNTAPNPSAMLDLNPDDGDNAVRGLALPRVRLVSTTSSTPLAAHVTGMLVYNMVTVNDVKPGVYYNDGTKWIASGSGSINISDLGPNFYNEIQINISRNFSTELGDTIISYISNNVSEQLINNILSELNVASADNTVAVTGSGTNDIDLSVNVKEVANKLSKYITNTILGDTILKHVFDNLDDDKFGTIIQQYITNDYSNIVTYITNNFPPELNDKILEYITNNVTQELTNKIMAKVKVASADNTVTVTGSGTSNIDLSVDTDVIADKLVTNNTFVTNMGDTIAENINNTSLKDTIITLVKENSSEVKTLEISLNEVIATQSKTFFGTTATASSTIKIIGIEPQLTGNPVMLGTLLKVNALANLNSSATAINWTIAIENDNINPALSCTLEKVIISYISNEDLSGTKSGTYSIAGR